MDIERSTNELNKDRFIQEQKDYMYYMMHKREINELLDAKKTGKLIIEAPRPSRNSMIAEREIKTVMPEDIGGDSNNVFLRCAKLHSYDPDPTEGSFISA